VLSNGKFPSLIPEEALEILEGGRAFGDGKPPGSIPYGQSSIRNFRKDEPSQTVLGAAQKALVPRTTPDVHRHVEDRGEHRRDPGYASRSAESSFTFPREVATGKAVQFGVNDGSEAFQRRCVAIVPRFEHRSQLYLETPQLDVRTLSHR
jgi:hypothetical protein